MKKKNYNPTCYTTFEGVSNGVIQISKQAEKNQVNKKKIHASDFNHAFQKYQHFAEDTPRKKLAHNKVSDKYSTLLRGPCGYFRDELD